MGVHKEIENPYRQEESPSLRSSKVDLNNLMKKVKDEQKKNKRQGIVISVAALSAVAVCGVILTL